MSTPLDLKKLIRDVPDFPKPGIVFKDITPLLADPGAFRETVDRLAQSVRDKKPRKIIAIESRGFIFGAALAQTLGAGFVPVRKKGKLPYKSLSASYALEYGTDTLEMHVDALQDGEQVVIADDVLATGGTAKAVAELVRAAGAVPAAAVFLIELGFLTGREKMAGLSVTSLIHY
jgi:adenine phosphoribosyltransferase